MKTETPTVNLPVLTEEITAELGPTYRAKFEDAYGVTIRQEGNDRDFGFHLRVFEGKIRIRGTYAKTKDGFLRPYNHSLMPSINVSPTKTARQIAGDIKRRLLDEYITVFDQAKIERDEHDQYNATQTENLEAINKLIKGRIQGEQIFGGPNVNEDRGYLAKCQIGREVTLEIRSMPVAVAERVIKAWLGENK